MRLYEYTLEPAVTLFHKHNTRTVSIQHPGNDIERRSRKLLVDILNLTFPNLAYISDHVGDISPEPV
jgi:hypothetical protein